MSKEIPANNDVNESNPDWIVRILQDGHSPEVVTALQQYRENQSNPEAITTMWEEIWREWGGRVGMGKRVSEIPNLADTEISLDELKGKGRMPIYVPNQVATMDPALLTEIYPDMQILRNSPGVMVENVHPQMGWLTVESSIETPNISESRSTLNPRLLAESHTGLNQTTYIIASQYSRMVSGRYLDEGEETICRLLQSRMQNYEDTSILGKFTREGALYMQWDPAPSATFDRVGIRTTNAFPL